MSGDANLNNSDKVDSTDQVSSEKAQPIQDVESSDAELMTQAKSEASDDVSSETLRTESERSGLSSENKLAQDPAASSESTHQVKDAKVSDPSVQTQVLSNENTFIKTGQKPDIYKIGVGRQIVLWVLFVLFLPFFLSMPVMIFMRATTGHATDAISLTVIFVLAAIAMFFIILQIAAVGRTRVELHDDRIGMRLPTWRGPNPFGPVTVTKLAYSEIAAIESRGELYTFMGVLGLREVSTVVTKDGRRHVLGYVTENEDDAPIPVDRISKKLSERMAMPISYRGAVHAGTQLGAMFKGAPAWDAAPLDTTQVDKIRKRAGYVAAAFITGFFLLLISGIVLTLKPDLLNFASGSSEAVKPASTQGATGKTR